MTRRQAAIRDVLLLCLITFLLGTLGEAGFVAFVSVALAPWIAID